MPVNNKQSFILKEIASRWSFLFFVFLVAACEPLPARVTFPEVQPSHVNGTESPPNTRTPSRTPIKKTLAVFCAGSLLAPFHLLEKAYESKHPDVDISVEGYGSIQVIRHITELRQQIDVAAIADEALIPLLMYTTQDPATGKPYATWSIRFASNRLAVAYSPRSKFADQVSSENWYEILAQPGVRVGISDPRFDPAGYRSLMSLKLAEMHYRRPGILDSLIRDSFRPPITVLEEDEHIEISVPEILETMPGSNTVLRGSSVQLIALLESGDLDYAFEYESVIRQHGLSWIELPDEINLGTAEMRHNYQKVQVKLDFQRYATTKPVFKGEEIGYGITIPGNAPSPELAADFIAFLLSPEGHELMATSDLSLIQPLVCDRTMNMPANLSHLCPTTVQP